MPPKLKTIKGALISFCETGTEGVIWALQRNASKKQWSYDDLFPIDDGDHLTVLDGKTIIWEGFVNFDWDVFYRQYPWNPECGQQCVFMYWVHGIQKGVAPELWASWFNLLGEKEYTGKLIKHVENQ